MEWQYLCAAALWALTAYLIIIKAKICLWTLPALAAAVLTALAAPSPCGCVSAGILYGAATVTHMIRREKTVTGAIVMALVFAGLGAFAVYKLPGQGSLYAAAMEDAVFSEPDEIRELVEITPDAPLTTWSEGRVLMLSWHSSPEIYAAGSTVTADDYGIWTFTDGEILKWYSENGLSGDAEARLEQLIGLPAGSGYTHVTAFWCDTAELMRPAYVTDITSQLTPEALDGSQLGGSREWFDDNALWSYIYSEYPWTRLGYTYDWSGKADEYGLSEFLILPASEIEVEWTKSTEEFINWLKQES